MSAKPPILIICHIFPPAFGIAGRRWAKFAKALAHRGHVVHVIAAEPQAGQGHSPWTADIDHPGIIVHRLPWNYPAVITRWPLTRFLDKVAYRIWLRVLPLFSTGNYFDMTIFWRRPLLKLAGDLIQTHGIKQLVVTGAPFRLNVYGTELKRMLGVQLTTDLRDPWTWHMEYGHSSLSSRKMGQEKAFEQLVVMESDHVIVPSLSMLAHLKARYPERIDRFVHLPHAIDTEELGEAFPSERDECTRLIYAGTLYGTAEAGPYFKQLLAAFDHLKDRSPEVYERTRLDLYITGTESEVHKRFVEQSRHRNHIMFHAPVSAREIRKRIAEADAVLIFIPSYNKDFLGTKFNETFYLRRPVIHVGEPGAVGRHIVENRLGTSIRVENLPDLLPDIITGAVRLDIDTSYDLSDQTLDHITDRLVKEVLQL
jgi:glycosyltransferase involved in cell wall biosynthesis